MNAGYHEETKFASTFGEGDTTTGDYDPDKEREKGQNYEAKAIRQLEIAILTRKEEKDKIT